MQQDAEYACWWTVKNVYREGDTLDLIRCFPAFPRHYLQTLLFSEPAPVLDAKLQDVERQMAERVESDIKQTVGQRLEQCQAGYGAAIACTDCFLKN